MKFIDTHCHLYLPEFDLDRDDVISRAQNADIEYIMLPNIDSSTLLSLKTTVKSKPEFFLPMIGLHPCSVKENFREELHIIENELKKEKFIAVGEIGIDLYWDKTFVKEQEEALKFQLDLALRYNLPVAIHMRDSFETIADIMEDYRHKKLRGVFHCFTGDLSQANFIIGLGLKLGIGGVLTFKNSALDKVIQQIDIQHIMLETDAPYLSPVPFRGKRNESSFMIKTAEKLATIYQLPLQEIAQITTYNAKQLFGI